MGLGGFCCPYCGCYNAVGEAKCLRCERRLPPAFIAPYLGAILRTEHLATKSLAGAIAFAFSCQIAASRGTVGFLRGMPISTMLRFGAFDEATAFTQPYRWLASCFAHFGALHVAFNLLALADLGRLGEETVGAARFALAFFVTGVLGMVASAYWFGDSVYITAGASGGVFGLQGLLLGELIAKRDRRWRGVLVRTVFYSVVWYYALHTNQAAHLGGLVVGVGLGFAFAKERRPWRHDAIVYGLLAAFAIGTPFSIALCQRDGVWQAAYAREQAARSVLGE